MIQGELFDVDEFTEYNGASVENADELEPADQVVVVDKNDPFCYSEGVVTQVVETPADAVNEVYFLFGEKIFVSWYKSAQLVRLSP